MIRKIGGYIEIPEVYNHVFSVVDTFYLIWLLDSYESHLCLKVAFVPIKMVHEYSWQLTAQLKRLMFLFDS